VNFLVEREDRSKNVSDSKLKVKVNFKTIRTRLVPIMKLLDDGYYSAKIASTLGLSKPHVDYYVKKLRQAGLIRREKRSSIVPYEVTKQGKEFLAGSESVLLGSRVWRLHAAKYRYGLVSELDGHQL